MSQRKNETREEYLARKAAYNASPEGKARVAAYEASPERKARKAAYNASSKGKEKKAAYNARPEVKAKMAAYNASSKVKEKKAAYNARPEVKAKMAAYNASSKVKARVAAYNASSKGKEKKAAYNASPEGKASRAVSRMKRYGLTPADFEAMLVAQHYKCANENCNEMHLPNKPLNVDHDHSLSGKESVRELLCRDCNLGAGFLRDKSARARGLGKYIDKHEKKKVLRARRMSMSVSP